MCFLTSLLVLRKIAQDVVDTARIEYRSLDDDPDRCLGYCDGVVASEGAEQRPRYRPIAGDDDDLAAATGQARTTKEGLS